MKKSSMQIKYNKSNNLRTAYPSIINMIVTATSALSKCERFRTKVDATFNLCFI